MDPIIENIKSNKEITADHKKEIIDIYNEYKKINVKQVDFVKLQERTEKVLKEIFKIPYMGVLIPLDFINSEIGKVLFKIKLEAENLTEVIYSVAECAIIADKSKRMILNDITNKRFISYKNSGQYYIKENELIKYLTTVGRKTFTEEEAKKRLYLFKQLKDEGYTLVDIKDKMSVKR